MAFPPCALRLAPLRRLYQFPHHRLCQDYGIFHGEGSRDRRIIEGHGFRLELIVSAPYGQRQGNMGKSLDSHPCISEAPYPAVRSQI